MAEHRPAMHLLRAGEELLRAAADALARAREQAETENNDGYEKLLADAASSLLALLREDPARSLKEMERALRDEHARWEARRIWG